MMQDGPNDMSVVCVCEELDEKWLKCDGRVKITSFSMVKTFQLPSPQHLPQHTNQS